jgi:hypothetical protein
MATLKTSITAGLAYTRTLPTPNRRGDGNEVLWCGQPTDQKEYNGIEKETETRFQHVMAEAGKRPEA